MPQSYAKNVLIALDQLANAILIGSPDETLSARCWRNRNKSWYWAGLRKVVDWIFFFEDNHCFSAYLAEIDRKQLPTHYRISGKII